MTKLINLVGKIPLTWRIALMAFALGMAVAIIAPVVAWLLMPTLIAFSLLSVSASRKRVKSVEQKKS